MIWIIIKIPDNIYFGLYSIDGKSNQGTELSSPSGNLQRAAVNATILKTNVSIFGTNLTSENSNDSDFKAYKGQILFLNTFDMNSTASNSAWSGSDKRAIRWGTEEKVNDNIL